MPVHVVFLRAVNVGKRQVRMADLREVLEDAGFDEVETYIQTGNVRVRSSMRSGPKVAQALEAAIEDWKGFPVPCVLRTPAQLRSLVADVDAVPALLRPAGRRYVAIADGVIHSEAAAELEAWDVDGERVRVLGSAALVEMGHGVAETRLTNTRVEKLTGRTMTWRDLKVVRELSQRWGT